MRVWPTATHASISLSRERQPSRAECGAAQLLTVEEWWRSLRIGGFEALKVANVQIIEANPAFVADVRKRTEPLVQDWIKSANAKGVDGAKAWAEYQDELKKVAASVK